MRAAKVVSPSPDVGLIALINSRIRRGTGLLLRGNSVGDPVAGTVTRTEFGRAQFAILSSGSGRGGGSPRPERFVSEDADRVAGALDLDCVVDSGVNRQEALG
jgi:hypothetical protein